LATWKILFPNSRVLSINTGFSRIYGRSLYGDYNTNNDRFLFPVPKYGRLPSKQRVHAMVDGTDAKACKFFDFEYVHNGIKSFCKTMRARFRMCLGKAFQVHSKGSPQGITLLLWAYAFPFLLFYHGSLPKLIKVWFTNPPP